MHWHPQVDSRGGQAQGSDHDDLHTDLGPSRESRTSTIGGAEREWSIADMVGRAMESAYMRSVVEAVCIPGIG